MIILATGATGFIGKHVVNKLLAENFDVYYLSRNNGQKERCFQANIFDKDAIEAVIKKIKPDILVHFAWEVEHGKYWDNPDNKIYKDASINLFLTFLHYGGKKIIGAGSCAEYCTSVKPTIENTIINNSALSLYGQAKREVYEWLEQNVEDFIWLRIFGVYGKGEDQRRILPYLTYCVKNNIVPNIQKKKFLYRLCLCK
jgi:nucleoside-diphosphate-sugar epimerase